MAVRSVNNGSATVVSERTTISVKLAAMILGGVVTAIAALWLPVLTIVLDIRSDLEVHIAQQQEIRARQDAVQRMYRSALHAAIGVSFAEVGVKFSPPPQIGRE